MPSVPRRRVGIALVVGLLAATVLALGVGSSRTSGGGSATTSDESDGSDETGPAVGAADDADASGPTLGVQVFAMWRDWETQEALMDRVQESGAGWIRVDVGWCSLEERGPGLVSPWYQDRLDATVAAAAARDLSLLVTLTCSPTWARADGRTRALPDDPAQYGRVAGWLAERYRGRIAAWELWNEPDCLDLGCSNADPLDYVPVLRAGWTAVKAADPGATVISGGTSGINLTWIQTMLDAGAGDYMDGLAVNPYLAPADDPPDVPPTAGGTEAYRITNTPALHQLLADAGHPTMPVWFTELGWSTGRTPGSVYDGVPEATQAAYLTQALDLVADRYPYVAHVFWFTLRDRDDASAHENGYGLLHLDGTPKPSWAAFAALAGSTRYGAAAP